jgi:three-Cys-motif partner protein
MIIKNIPWEVEPHTIIKHKILEKYLYPWMAILSSKHKRIVYLDGFAGPGEYLNKKGEIINGSPLIAINCYLAHKLKKMIKEVCFIFIDKNPDVIKYLENKLKSYSNYQLKIKVINAEFENAINNFFNKLDQNDQIIAPTFCFIDPFGIKGLPLTTIKKVINKDHCEVFINFMYEELIRFISLPENEKNVCELFGDDNEWKKYKNQTTPKEKYFFLVGLYEKQLRMSCESECYIRTFSMINKFNKYDYVMFFVTKNKLGLKKMKEAMWSVDETGEFSFSDFTYNPYQATLFSKQPDYKKLKEEIIKKFNGKKVDAEEVFDYGLVNTAFLDSHVRKILTQLEEEKLILVERNGQKRKGAFPPRKTIIDFIIH